MEKSLPTGLSNLQKFLEGNKESDYFVGSDVSHNNNNNIINSKYYYYII